LLVAALSPHSATAEQYRAIRTRISQSEGTRHCRTILVTSPLSSDGKTLTALNLALTMAQEFHRRVVAIDADLRNGSLHRLFGIPERPGLSDVLTGSVSLEQALVSLPDFRLTLLPSGSPADSPTELLGSAEMRRVIDTLHTQFDRVVIDTPPASPLADVGVLAPLVDGVVLVVRAGRTPRPAIDRALEEFDPNRLLGLVLNDVEEPRLEVHP
jgi:capsular exopolysaccharide synthesis family protein